MQISRSGKNNNDNNNNNNNSTVEPPIKGHLGTSHFVPCREVILFSEVENVLHIHVHFWGYRKCRSFVERLSLSRRVFY